MQREERDEDGVERAPAEIGPPGERALGQERESALEPREEAVKPPDDDVGAA